MSVKDQVLPEGKWNFEGEVTDSFDNMLERSIPQYQIMRNLCYSLALEYAKIGTTILDIGSSRGGAIAELISYLGHANRFIGLEISEPMIQAARERFKDRKNVEIHKHDLRQGLPKGITASVVLSILTIQFVPIEYRQQLLKDIYKCLLPDGALILVEKVLGNTSRIDKDMVKIYYNLKSAHEYTQEQIERKRLSLEGVLVPITAKWNEDLLRQTGFNEIDSFWRWMNFAGWIAIK
jgi:tRNA (cmo5U34)-methyltransferase